MVATESQSSARRVLDAVTVERLLDRVTVGDDRDRIEVRSALTGDVLGAIPAGGERDVIDAVQRARDAQQRWAQTSFATRRRVLTRFHDLVLDRQDEVLDLIQVESGKSRGHAFEEVADAAIVAAYYARTGESHVRTRRREGALPLVTSTEEHHHPRGVIGFIAPWNYPLSMAITDAIPALMAGNACVIKPAQQTPFTALWVARLLDDAGLPPDLLHIVTGAGSTVGGALIDHTDFVTFTGSTEVGRQVAAQAGRNLIDCALELGGKNAMLVLGDADLSAAVAGAIRGCFASAGQLCISIERLFVHRDVLEEFTDRFVAATASLELGAALDYGPDMGSLISQDQLDTVRTHVRDAVDKGARVLTGGSARPDLGPFFHEPTVLTDVTPAMTLYSDETFGPVVTIYPFDDVEQALDRINDSAYGLNASVWTRDVGRGRELATRIQAGTVNINEAYAAAWASVDAPMGGFKSSGVGRRHGREGILKYTESQTVAVQRLVPIGQFPGLSMEATAKVLSVGLRLLHKVPGLRRP